MNISIHDVESIELVSYHPHNHHARTVRVIARNHEGHKVEHELTFFGRTWALGDLPIADEYVSYGQEAAE